MKDTHETRDFHRGEIYYADLNPAFSQKQDGIRPVLVLLSDVGNCFCPMLVVTQVSWDPREAIRAHPSGSGGH